MANVADIVHLSLAQEPRRIMHSQRLTIAIANNCTWQDVHDLHWRSCLKSNDALPACEFLQLKQGPLLCKHEPTFWYDLMPVYTNLHTVLSSNST